MRILNVEIGSKCQLEDDVVKLTSNVEAKKITTKHKRKLRSLVWTFFEMLSIGEDKKKYISVRNMDWFILLKVNMKLVI